MSMKEDKHLSEAVEEDRPQGGCSRRDILKLGAAGVVGVAGSAALGAQPPQLNARESGPEEKRMADRTTQVEDIPVVLECAINETRKMPYEPRTVQEHIAEMTKVLDAGAAIAHGHSKQFDEDPKKAAQFYAEVYRAVFRKHPHAIVYPTINLDLGMCPPSCTRRGGTHQHGDAGYGSHPGFGTGRGWHSPR
jgi:hypothetical protein